MNNLKEITEKKYIKIMKSEDENLEEHKHSVTRLFDTEDGIYRFYKKLKLIESEGEKNER